MVQKAQLYFANWTRDVTLSLTKMNQTMCFHATLFFPEIEHAPLQPHTSQNRLNTKIIVVFLVFICCANANQFSVAKKRTCSCESRMNFKFCHLFHQEYVIRIALKPGARTDSPFMSSIWGMMRRCEYCGAKTVAGNSSLSFLNIFSVNQPGLGKVLGWNIIEYEQWIPIPLQILIYSQYFYGNFCHRSAGSAGGLSRTSKCQWSSDWSPLGRCWNIASGNDGWRGGITFICDSFVNVWGDVCGVATDIVESLRMPTPVSKVLKRVLFFEVNVRDPKIPKRNFWSSHRRHMKHMASSVFVLSRRKVVYCIVPCSWCKERVLLRWLSTNHQPAGGCWLGFVDVVDSYPWRCI